ncbi:MAG: lamin tail domain-containing protein [Anaerolineales bacterium]|nr:lamin tail domain-containing protein [Anaerolineales bacterium]
MTTPKLTLALAALLLAALACVSAGPVPTKAPVPPTQPPPTTFNCIPQNTQRQTAELVAVIDGDTIDVRIDGQVQRVRYIGVDTPEREDPYYQEASAANRILLGSGQLTLVRDVSDTDRYDRLLRYVLNQQGVFVNYELIHNGYAHLVTFPPDVACADTFLAAQEDARTRLAGIWALPHFQQPDAPAVVIDQIFYNGQNDPESDEYAQIRNASPDPVQLNGWTLSAGYHQDFIFPAFELAPGQTCRVYTNEVHPESCGFSFGRDESLWSNAGDCAHLYDPGGSLVDEQCYGNN